MLRSRTPKLLRLLPSMPLQSTHVPFPPTPTPTPHYPREILMSCNLETSAPNIFAPKILRYGSLCNYILRPRGLPRRLLHGSNAPLRNFAPQTPGPKSRRNSCQIPQVRASTPLAPGLCHHRVRRQRIREIRRNRRKTTVKASATSTRPTMQELASGMVGRCGVLGISGPGGDVCVVFLLS